MLSLERMTLYECIKVNGVALFARLPRLRDVGWRGLPNVARRSSGLPRLRAVSYRV